MSHSEIFSLNILQNKKFMRSSSIIFCINTYYDKSTPLGGLLRQAAQNDTSSSITDRSSNANLPGIVARFLSLIQRSLSPHAGFKWLSRFLSNCSNFREALKFQLNGLQFG